MTSEWADIALPALRQIHAWENEEDAFDHDTQDVAKALGIEDVDRVGRQLEALAEAELITIGDARASRSLHNYINLRLAVGGRRALGEWPSDSATAFLDAVQQAIEHHLGGTDEKRLKKLLRLLRKMSPELLRTLVHGAALAAS